jgi:YL1 nuclear protein
MRVSLIRLLHAAADGPGRQQTDTYHTCMLYGTHLLTAARRTAALQCDADVLSHIHSWYSTAPSMFISAVQEIDAEEDEADNQFWKQDFFAESKQDEDYSTESEEVDEADSDFSKSESDDDEDEEANEKKLKSILKVKKAKDRPPGWKQAAQRRANMLRAKREKAKSAADADDGELHRLP